jgi:hypothetical protein
MKANGTAYVPTLVVYEPQQDRSFEPGEWKIMRSAERKREETRMAASIEAIPANWKRSAGRSCGRMSAG